MYFYFFFRWSFQILFLDWDFVHKQYKHFWSSLMILCKPLLLRCIHFFFFYSGKNNFHIWNKKPHWLLIAADSCILLSFRLICSHWPKGVRVQKADRGSWARGGVETAKAWSFQSLSLFTIPQLLVSMESLWTSSRCHTSEPTREQQWVTMARKSHPLVRARSSCSSSRHPDLLLVLHAPVLYSAARP